MQFETNDERIIPTWYKRYNVDWCKSLKLKQLLAKKTLYLIKEKFNTFEGLLFQQLKTNKNCCF